MKERNDYGMMSGAFIFDRMDRAALLYIRKKAHLSKKITLVTEQVSNLVFVRQVCRKPCTICFSGFSEQPHGRYYVCVHFLDDCGVICARGDFLFCEAHNYCEAL